MNKIYKVTNVKKSGSHNSFFTKKIALILIGLLGTWANINAQVTLTATAATLAGSYTTLGGAFTAINAGTHQGAIVISINANTIEGATVASLNSSGTGAASYATVLIQPTANNLTISGNSTTTVVKLNGADNVTIDGFFGGTRQLTITNTNPSLTDVSACIWLACASASDGATNNNIKNCIVKGAGVTITFINIVQSGTVLGGIAEIGNSNNKYQNNLVTGGESGIAVVGPTGNEVGTLISGNTIGSTIAADKMSFRSIFVAQQRNVTITGNTILGSSSTVTGVGFENTGISVNGTMTNGKIEKNTISDIKKVGVWGCSGIFLNSSTPVTSLVVSNNFISDIASTGFNGTAIDDNGYGIAVAAGGGYIIQYNSVNLATNQTSSVGTTAALWFSTSVSINTLDVRDNIFSNQQTNSTRYAVYCPLPNTIFTNINYNDYYSLGSLGFLGAPQATLANWQTATGQDANSLAVNPSFTTPSNLHLFFNSPLDAVATPIAGITSDIDGDVRNAVTPDIGADEFTPPNCSGNNGGVASASITSICASGTATLSSAGYDYGLGIAYQWEYNVGGPWLTLAGQTNAASASTGLISVTTQYRLKVTCSAGAPGYSNIVTITVNNPVPLTTTPGTRCGVGTVNLAATGTGLQWYAALTGGSPLGSGSPFTTPVISATTPFYVSSSVIGSTLTGGNPSTTGANGTNPVGGINFTANTGFTLNSVVMYPTAAGTNTINLYPGTATTGPPIFTITVPFAGANPAGQVVPIGWNIPPGSYTIYLSVSGAACWRDFTGAYPYNIGTACTLTNGSISGFYYFFYNWNITEVCEGTRTAVNANVTAPPAISPTATPAAICIGASVNLNVTSGNAGYTYVWTPGPLSGAAQTVSPIVTTAYTITATDMSGGANNGCVNVGTVNVTVTPTPTTLTVSPSVANVCAAPIITTITASGGQLVNQSIFTEYFETFPTLQFTPTGAGITATSNTTYFQQGAKSVLLTNIGTTNTTSQYSVVNNIPLNTLTSPVLSFYHICASEKTFDFGYVEYSTDGGTSWTTFPTSSYLGSGTLFNGVVSFDANSYTDWSAQFTSSASTPGTGPATSLWKHETIDLTPWQGSSTFKFRFRYTSDPSVVYYGWLIDNVTITGTGQAPVTWLPVANLYTDPAATVPYVGGTSYLVVYTKPPGSVIYTATASGGSCSSSATANLTVTGVVVNVSIAANPGTTICNGGCVTFTATPTNGGTTPFYTWKVNGGTVASGIGMNTYTSCTLATGNLVTCVLLSNVGSCASNNPATSNTLTMTVNPNPTVNITGLTTVCNNAPPTVLTANASVAPGSIATYEWFLGAVSQGVPSAINTFNATLPGSYTVVATTVAGCPTTSAPFVVTLPTYTITATSGPNGTISPSGAVVVNCGDDITFTMTPNAFYSIFDVLVDGSSVGPVGTYTFMNVTAPHTISVTFFLVGCPTPATADAGPDGSFCANATYTLAGSITNASTIIWTGGTGTYNPNNTTLNAIYTPGLGEVGGTAVTLTLTTNDPPGPCVASSDNVTLTIRTIPSVSITGVAGFCPSSSTTLTAVASITPAGPITYAWLYNGVTSLGTAVTQVSSSGAGNYQVTATANSCSNTASVAVVAFVSPSVTITGSNLICTGTPTTLSASVVAGSGAIPINGYQWYRNAVLIAGATSSTYATTLAANYTVTITDANGCISALSPIFTLSNDLSPLNGIYTISAAPASCTNYTSFALAINDLNTRFVGGDVTFNISAGYTETAPVLGLPLGSAGLNASLAGRTLSFKKVGIGANPLITAYAGGTATPSSAIPDGIWSLRGVDNVIIDAIDLVDNNASGNAMMEYGYGLFKASTTDGTQNITIQNCTITLNKVNNAASVAPMLEGSTAILVCNSTATTATTATTPTAASGTNSNNKFYTNIIQNCNHGIALSGYAAASPFTLGDTGNDIGGLSGTTGNTIVNFGGGGALVACGIRLLNQWSSNVSFNTVNNNNGAGINHTGILRGIYGQAGLGASVTISNNIITVNSGGNTALCSGIENSLGASGAANTVIISNNTVTGSIALATTALFSAIVNTSTANATTVNMNGNIVENCTLPATGTGAWTGISNQAVVATLSLSNNILRNCTISSVGAFTGIANSSATAVTSQNISGNEISGNVKANATPINWMATGLYTTSLVNNNTVINNTVNAAATAVTVNCILASSTGGVVTADGNLISNNSITGITAGIATLSGISNIASTTGETYSNNLIRKLFVTGTATTFLHVIQGLNTNTAAASAKTISGNTVANLYSSSTLSATVYGIRNATGATVNIFKNKIDSLFPGQNGATAGSLASGIRIQSGTTVNTHDNYINLDLTAATAPAANAVLTANDALKGVEYTAVTAVTLNLYYNTIRLAGAGSGANFGSSGVGIISTTPTVDMRNNIIVNLTTPGGSATGLAVAYRRPAAVGATYSTNSNNNLFYSGVPSASRLLYFDGTTGYQTMATYQAGAGIAPREGVSVNVSPNFISATNLHLMPGKNCSTDGQAQVIAGYTGDYDTDVRSGTFPDIGADEFNGTGVGIGVWAGTIDGDWNNVLNWCDAVPDSKVNVTIPSGAPNYPAITSLTLPAPAAKNFIIAVGGTVTITGTGKLGIYGTVSNSGTFNTVDGTIEMASTAAAQTIPAATFQNNDLKNLIISNNAGAVTLGGTLNLYGKLSYTKSTCTFATAGFLVLRSTAAGTAYVADITNVGANAGNTITGDVSVERFMGMRRAWRLLAAPTQHNLQNIHQAWQENQAPNATTPVGYGIQMTSSAATWAADGFDMSTPAGPSIKVYNPALNVWDPLPATVGASGNFTAGKGYMTLVRGDRTINFFQAVATTTTVLRDKGLLNTNTFAAPAIGAAQFALIGNPFASAVDFTKFTKTNLQDVYYLWDPYLGSLGGYVTFAGPSYTPTPSLSYTSNKFIESGQAFFVRSSGPAGTLSFPEVSKVSGSYLVSRPAAPGKQLQANLYLIDAGGRNLYDGVTSEFDGSYSNTVDNQDALKLSNFGENLGIRRNDKTLSVERMKELVKTDTIFYNLGQMRVKHYQFEFTPDNIGQTGLAAFLEDRYLNIKTPVSLTDITTVDFTIINEPGSYAPDRFRIVFALAGPVPVTFSSIRANRQRNDILVEWKVENELNIAHYDVEKSADGLNFSKVNETAARGNGSGAAIQYNWLDTNPFDGNNFYRIRSVGISNEAKLSQIVKVDMGKLPASITVFPNPVREDGMLYIGLSNQPAGVYQLALVNSTGQTMMKQSLNHAGGNSVYSIMMDKYVAHGNYLVNIAGNNNVKLTFKVVY